MISSSIRWFFLLWLLSVVPVLLSRRNGETTWWDYVSPFSGVIAWFVLTMLKIGSIVSLSNFAVECFWIIATSSMIPWCRWGLSFSKKGIINKVSFTLSLMPVALAIVLRLTVPSLPE
jgi:hypothetical protein